MRSPRTSRPLASLMLISLLGACGDASGPQDTDASSTSPSTSDGAGETTTGGTTSDASAGATGSTAPATGGGESDSAGATTGGTVSTTSDGGASDGGTSDTEGEPPASKCEQTPTAIICPKETVELEVGLLITRDVHWQVPSGEPPPGGWPIAFMFQGSLFTSELNWVGQLDGPFGMYYQVLTLKRLLDAGYAVITPEAHAEGSTFWDTNVPPFSSNWELSPDHDFMLAIFDAIDQGTFGPLNSDIMYATGISSGGYMTSRMAVSYPGMFTALAIQSASYATCSGPLCSVPPLDGGHPPTLFLAGGEDPLIPISTVYTYRDALVDAGVETEVIVDPAAGHEWIEAAPDAVLGWFDGHPP
ncbi:MAG: hypothetical protein KC468_20715 [Myxococcales bacterium]|nr:hypothetical protein [Myxococcales bacterium]